MIDKVSKAELVRIAKSKGFTEAQISKMSFDELSALISNTEVKTTGTLYKGFNFLDPQSTQKTNFNGNIWSAQQTPTVSNEADVGFVKTQVKPQITQQVEKPVISAEQAQDFSIEQISQNTQSALNLFLAQEDNQGLVSKGYDEIKNLLKTKLSSTRINKTIDNEVTGLNFLSQAKEKTLSKREYYEQNKQRLLEMIPDFDTLTEAQKQNIKARIDSLPIQGVKDLQHKIAMLPNKDKPEYKQEASAMLAEFKSSTETPTFEKGGIEGQQFKTKMKVNKPNSDMNSDELISYEEVFKYERGAEYSKDKVQTFEEKKAALNFVSGAKQKYEQLKQNADDIDVTDTNILKLYTNYFGDSKKAQEFLQNIATEKKLNIQVNSNNNGELSIQYLNNQFDKSSLKTLLKGGVEGQEAQLNKVLNGKSYEQYQTDYATSYTTAYGTKNAEELAKAYGEDQENINAKATGAVQIAGMGSMVIGGVACLIPGAQPIGAGMISVGGKMALGGMLAKTALDVVNESTKKDGMSDEAAKAIIKEAAINAGSFAIGMGAGMTGAKVGASLLANGSSKLVSVVAERGVDFTISALGDLAMIGDVNIQGNMVGVVTATALGLKTSKNVMKNHLGDEVPTAKSTEPSFAGNKTAVDPETEFKSTNGSEIQVNPFVDANNSQGIDVNKYSVSKATEADLKEIHKIDMEAFAETDPVAHNFSAYKADVEGQGLESHVIKSEDGKVIGYYQLEPIKDGELYIYSIGVPKELRKTKSSFAALSKMQENIKQIATEKGATKVALHVNAEDANLVKLYKKFGFEVKNTEANYFENGNSAHYMEVNLGKAPVSKTAKIEPLLVKSQNTETIVKSSETTTLAATEIKISENKSSADELLQQYENISTKHPQSDSQKATFVDIVSEYKDKPEVLNAISKIINNNPENIRSINTISWFSKENPEFFNLNHLPEVLKEVPNIDAAGLQKLATLNSASYQTAKELNLLKPTINGRINAMELIHIKDNMPLEKQKYTAQVLNTPICESISTTDLINYKWQDLNLNVLSKLEYTPDPYESITNKFKDLDYEEFNNLTETQINKINERGLLKLEAGKSKEKFDADTIIRLTNIDDNTWNIIQERKILENHGEKLSPMRVLDFARLDEKSWQNFEKRDLLNKEIPNLAKASTGEYFEQGQSVTRTLDANESLAIAKLDDVQYGKVLSLLNTTLPKNFNNKISIYDLINVSALDGEAFNNLQKRNIMNNDNEFNGGLTGSAIVNLSKLSDVEYLGFSDLYKYVQDNRGKLVDLQGDVASKEKLNGLLLTDNGVTAYEVLGAKAIKHSMDGRLQGFTNVVENIGGSLKQYKPEILTHLKGNLTQLPHPEQQIARAQVVSSMGKYLGTKGLTEFINLIKSPKMTDVQVRLADDIFSNGKSYEQQIDQFITEFNVPVNKQPLMRKFLQEAQINEKLVSPPPIKDQITALERKLDLAKANDKIPLAKKEEYIKQIETQIQMIKENSTEYTRPRVNDKTLKSLAQQVEAHINLENDTKIFNDKAYTSLFNQLDVDSSPELISAIKFDDKYFSTLFVGLNKDGFKENFKTLINLVKENPGGKLSEIRENIPENKQTRELFKQNGLNYAKWIKFDENSKLGFELEVKAEDVLKATKKNLMSELAGADYDAIGGNVSASLRTKFKEAGLYSDNAMFDNSITVFKDNLSQKELSKTIKIIEDEIATNPVFKTNNAEAKQFMDHIQIHKKNIKALESVKDTNEELFVRLSDDDDIGRNIFLGNHVGCCTSIGSFNSFAAPQHLMNSFVRGIEIVDKGGNSMGNSMCYFAKVDGKLTFVIDSFEANGKLGADKKVTDAIVDYAKQVTKEMGQPNANIMFGPNYNKINFDRCIQTTDHTLEMIGRSPESTYIDAFGGSADINQPAQNKKMYEIMDL